MTRKTGSLPSADDTFLWRICKALDEPPRMLASNIGVPYSELAPLLDPLNLIVDIDRDEVWWKVRAYLDERIGLMMAARSELDKALQADRVKRAYQIDRLGRRERKGSLRVR